VGIQAQLSKTMKITSLFIFQMLNLTMIHASDAPLKNHFSTSRTLDDSIPNCPDKSETFQQFNTVFREGLYNDRACDIIHESDVRYCNYDQATSNTAESCDTTRNVLYVVNGEKICDYQNRSGTTRGSTSIAYMNTVYENVYLCVAEGCDVGGVLEEYQREVESNGRCSMTFVPQTHPNDNNSSLEDRASSNSGMSTMTDYHMHAIVFAWVVFRIGRLAFVKSQQQLAETAAAAAA